MSQCELCGAPITLSYAHSVTCRFCQNEIGPQPRQVHVPVPVKIVHNVVNVVGKTGAAADLHACPHCRRPLVALVIENVTLEGCGSCGGIWIANDSALRVLQAPEAIFSEMARRAGNNAKNRKHRASAPACPVCGALLVLANSHGIELDTCSDHGTWFDAYELARLVGVLTGHESVPISLDEAQASDDRIRCAQCRISLPTNRANIGPQGLVCDGCWRTYQSAQIAAADAAHQQRSGAVGVLLGVAGIMLAAAASSRD